MLLPSDSKEARISRSLEKEVITLTQNGKKRLNEIAYTYIRDKIIYREFHAGMPLVEIALVRRLNISRTPIREALKRLEEEELVYSIPDKGTFVAHFTEQDIRETVELRIMLETAALKYCIESVTEEDILECREVVASISENDEIQVIREKDRKLHQLIAKYCTNRRLVEFLEIIRLQQERLRWSVLITPARLKRMQKDHLMLLDLIEKRDYKRTTKALTKHLSRFQTFISKNFDLNNV